MLKLVDLFAGTGAFSSAFEKTGKFEVVFANDFSDKSKEIYDLNHKCKLTLGDINDIDISSLPNHDILCGGFPCQPFSVAGNQEGFKDPRSNVFWTIIKIVKFHKPKWIVLENVKNLKNHDNGNTFNIIKNELENLNYSVVYKIINTTSVGIPHNRERIYIVCCLNDFLKEGEKGEGEKEKILEKVFEFKNIQKMKIQNFLEDNVSNKYYYNNNENKIHQIIKSSVINKNTFYQYRRYYVRENKNSNCPTLTANMGTGGHNVPIILDPKGPRKLTPRECFNLQGFSKDYKLPNITDSHLYKLAGNAVSIPVVEIIVNGIINY